jgi:hypothetical protein
MVRLAVGVALLLLAGCGKPEEQALPVEPPGKLITTEEATKALEADMRRSAVMADPTSSATGDAIANDRKQDQLERRVEDLERAQPTPEERLDGYDDRLPKP